MGFPSLFTVIEAAKRLTFADDGHTLIRTKGLWHVLMFLRHRRLHGLNNTYEFNSFDLSEACFDVNGIYLPIEPDSRNSYYEPAASQGNTTAKLFRHREGPRQTYLNRIYTGLTGRGRYQPNLFTASNQSLPTTISLVPNWIDELRAYDGNKAILDARIQEFITWLFRFGIPEENGDSVSIGVHESAGTIKSRFGVQLEPLPDDNTAIIEIVSDYLGLSQNQTNSLFPLISGVTGKDYTADEPITFHAFELEMSETFAKEINDHFENEADLESFFPSLEDDLLSDIDETDENYNRVLELLADGFAGVIFTGPPGTSKSWYASQIGIKLADSDSNRIRFIQFHGSYQYEDFIEGFIPVDGGGFKLVPKHLLEMCEIAEKAKGKKCILVIDELSRSDPARVFGEALTYIEMSKRGMSFRLASGKQFSIPRNLIFLATMNPMDKGVDEVDAALERRFAKIAMNPNADLLKVLLETRGMEKGLQNRVIHFFQNLLSNKNQMCRVGHAYFYGVKDEDGLKRLWQNQLYFHFEKAFRLDPDGFQEIERNWQKIFVARPAAVSEEISEEVI